MIFALVCVIIGEALLTLWAWFHQHHPPPVPHNEYHRQTAALRKAIDKQHRVLP